MTDRRFTRPMLGVVPAAAVLAAGLATFSVTAASAASTPPSTPAPATSAPATATAASSAPAISVPVSVPVASAAATSTPSVSGTPSAPATPSVTSTPAATSPAATAPAVAAPPPTGPDYSCQSLFGTEPYGSFTGRIPLTVSVTGPHTVGATDRVTVTGSSPEFGSSWPHANDFSVTGTLAVTGAQSGSVTFREQGNAADSNPLAAAGTLQLTTAGLVYLHLPRLFQVVFSLPEDPPENFGTHNCTLLTHPVPVAAVVHVTKPGATTSPSPSPSPSPTTSASATGTGAPIGAPATGGGPGPGAPGLLPALAGLLLLVGGGITTVAAGRSRTPRKAR